MFTSKDIFRLFLIGLFLLAGCTSRPASLNNRAFKRIISLSPNITETLYALRQQDRLVAVSDFCSYPPEVRQKERVGGLLNPNLEKILLLKPDVLIGTPAHASLAAKLDPYQLPVVLLPNDHLQDVFFTIDSLGHLLHCQKQAASLMRRIKERLQFYRDQALQLGHPRPTAALIIGRDPGSVSHLTVSGPHTFLDSLWQMLGGRNIFSDLNAKYAQVGQESFLNRKPQIIIEFKYKAHWDAVKDSLNFLEWQSLGQVPAVHNRQIYVLTGDYTLIPGPRIYLLARDYLHILENFVQTIHRPEQTISHSR